MIIPIRTDELHRLIPAVATSNQFKSALGDPSKILQRIMISTIGGVITLLISQSQVASRFYSIWLVIGVVFLLYLLWGPIVEAGQINSKLRQCSFSALFEGRISDVFVREKVVNRHEQANRSGELELVESRRTWMIVELEDEDGYLSELKFPLEKKHQFIRIGMTIRCLIFSQSRDFEKINFLSDAWVPQQKLWVGEYPYLLRPAFEELCSIKLDRG